MNCQEINFILDARAPEALLPAERQTVEQHFTSCQACRDAWAAYREIAALQPPMMPLDLRVRVATALAARAPAETRWPRRSLLLGGVLVVGAAVAAGIALQVADRAPDVARRSEEPLPAAAPALPAAPKAAPVAATAAAGSRADDAARTDGTSPPNPAPTSPAALALDPHSIVVLAIPDPAAEPLATAEFAKCHEQVLTQLRAVDGLNVIAGERVSAFEPFNKTADEIARELGAGTALVLRIMGGQLSCSATQIDAQTREERGNIMVVDFSESPPDGWKWFAERVAEEIRDATIKEPSAVIAEAQATVLNTALDDIERASALYKLRPEPTSGLEAYDDSVVAAAAQIATTSRDPRARAFAWNALRGVRNAYLTQPLLHSLSTDPEEMVRGAAAFALAYFVDEPGVRDALARAAAEDPPVRAAAERSLMSEQELRDAAVQTLLNSQLPDHERLAAITSSPDGRGVRDSLGDEAARAVFDIARRAEHGDLRSAAWWSLRRASPTPEFARALLEDLTSHPDENVRGAAASGLRRYTGDPAVRAALERAAAEDAAHNVRRRARMALDGVEDP